VHSEFPCDRAECSVLPRTGAGPDRHAPSRYARDGFRYVYLLADGARTSGHDADRVERRRHGRTGALGMWPVGSCELYRPRTEAEGKLVTDNDLSLRAPAQVAA
jgi:hypothetical protein